MDPPFFLRFFFRELVTSRDLILPEGFATLPEEARCFAKYGCSETVTMLPAEITNVTCTSKRSLHSARNTLRKSVGANTEKWGATIQRTIAVYAIVSTWLYSRWNFPAADVFVLAIQPPTNSIPASCWDEDSTLPAPSWLDLANAVVENMKISYLPCMAGFVLQILGGVVTAVGLLVTWWQWSERRNDATDYLTKLLLPRRRANVINSSGSFSADVEVKGHAIVTRPGAPLDERLIAIETDYGHLSARVADAVDALTKQIEQAHNDAVEQVDRRIDEALTDAQRHVARATLSGIWVAVAGIGLGLLGLIVAGPPSP